MKIRNKKNSANYVNFKDNGNPKKELISAGAIVDIPAITKATQIINFGDFKRGFFEIIEVEEKVEKVVDKSSSKKKTEDSLEKVKKEVKKYTDNKE
ncbi:MAG: hypothetical protein AABY15_04605 [Nanoarchaeota archaeon]